MPQILDTLHNFECEQNQPQTSDNTDEYNKIHEGWRPLKTLKSPKFYSDAGFRGRVYWIYDNAEDTLPRHLRQIATIIEQSRFILDIVPCEDNGQYDCNEQTWIRATEFLTKNAKWVWDIHSHVIDTPHILPGPENSIDLHWDYSGYELLINIPADPAEMAGFYGDDHGVISIKGKFDPNKINHGLLLWLAEER